MLRRSSAGNLATHHDIGAGEPAARLEHAQNLPATILCQESLESRFQESTKC